MLVVNQYILLHTRRVNLVDLQSWAAFATILGTMLAMFGTMAAMFRSMNHKFEALDTKIDGVGSKLDTKIDAACKELREEMRAGFNRMDQRMNSIDERVFELSTRLPPAPAASRG